MAIYLFFEYNIVNCGKNTLLIVDNNVAIAVGTVFDIESIPILAESINILVISKSTPCNKIVLKLFKEFHIPDFNNSTIYFHL